jgi:hypothetical protein
MDLCILVLLQVGLVVAKEQELQVRPGQAIAQKLVVEHLVIMEIGKSIIIASFHFPKLVQITATSIQLLASVEVGDLPFERVIGKLKVLQMEVAIQKLLAILEIAIMVHLLG